MKSLLALLVALSPALVAVAAGSDTAYDAINVVRKQRGDAVLKQLIQVRGEAGQPQPASWTVVMNDPTARRGIRELVVSNGAVISERTPVRSSALVGRPALNFPALNLDSDGAFKIANQQAFTRKVGFQTVNYTLRSNSSDGRPQWVLNLFDYMGAPVGTLTVSATDGKVISALQMDPDSREQAAVTVMAAPPPPVRDAEAEEDENAPTVFRGGVFGVVERTARRVGSTVRDTTLGVAGTVQEVLTGERTVDQGRGGNAED